MTSVSKPVDIDTFTRDALPQELGPGDADEQMYRLGGSTSARIEQALKAHYSYNPQRNWRMTWQTSDEYQKKNAF